MRGFRFGMAVPREHNNGNVCDTRLSHTKQNLDMSDTVEEGNVPLRAEGKLLTGKMAAKGDSLEHDTADTLSSEVVT